MNNEIATISKLNAFIESAPEYGTLINLENRFKSMERGSGVVRAKILICAKKLYNERFSDFYKSAGYDKTYASKVVKTESVIRMIEMWNESEIYNYSLTQLIEFARMNEDRFAELLANGEINPDLTIKEIKALANEVIEGDSAEGDSAEGDSAEDKSETKQETIEVELSTIYKMLESTNIVDIKHMLGALLHK